LSFSGFCAAPGQFPHGEVSRLQSAILAALLARPGRR
jgi:hypothetical protein